jgi:RimJ/RimL family protein N-acetyltransferase
VSCITETVGAREARATNDVRAPSSSSSAMIRTARLLLRDWTDADRDPFAAMNADPHVMRYFAAPIARADSDAAIDRYRRHLAQDGWGFWAVERCDTGVLIGTVGMQVPRFPIPAMPCVEIGWRLDAPHWGQGFAPEAAEAVLTVAFEIARLDEIVAVTALQNAPSRAVMEKLGMHDAHEDFDHPAVPEGSDVRRHCLYRLSRDAWVKRRAAGAPPLSAR